MKLKSYRDWCGGKKFGVEERRIGGALYNERPGFGGSRSRELVRCVPAVGVTGTRVAFLESQVGRMWAGRR